MQLFFIPGSSLALFLGILILAKKSKGHHDLVLATWLILIALHIGVFVLEQSGPLISAWLAAINASFPLLQGPLLFVYTDTLLHSSRLRAAHLAHGFPFMVIFVGLIIFQESMLAVLIASVVASGSTYILLTYRMLARSGKTTDHRKLHWLTLLTAGLGVIWLLFITTGIIGYFFAPSRFGHEYISIAVTLFVLISESTRVTGVARVSI
jgi:hypothetical protein